MLFSQIYLEMQIRLKLLGLVIGKFVQVKKVKSEPKKQNGIYPKLIVIVYWVVITKDLLEAGPYRTGVHCSQKGVVLRCAVE
jgi:hypothetical protein